MKKQIDNPYYDLISLSEWTGNNQKKIILLSHFPNMAHGLSIRGMYDHFYENSKQKEIELEKYFSSMGLTLTPTENRVCSSVEQFINK